MIANDPREPVQELVRLRAKVNLLLAMNSYATSDRKRDLEKISSLNSDVSRLRELVQEKVILVQEKEVLVQEKDVQLSEFRKKLQGLHEELSDVRESTSWRITALLRSVGSWAKSSRK